MTFRPKYLPLLLWRVFWAVPGYTFLFLYAVSLGMNRVSFRLAVDAFRDGL